MRHQRASSAQPRHTALGRVPDRSRRRRRAHGHLALASARDGRTRRAGSRARRVRAPGDLVAPTSPPRQRRQRFRCADQGSLTVIPIGGADRPASASVATLDHISVNNRASISGCSACICRGYASTQTCAAESTIGHVSEARLVADADVARSTLDRSRRVRARHRPDRRGDSGGNLERR